MADSGAELTRGMATVLAATAAATETRGCILWCHNPKSQDSSSMVFILCTPVSVCVHICMRGRVCVCQGVCESMHTFAYILQY